MKILIFLIIILVMFKSVFAIPTSGILPQIGPIIIQMLIAFVTIIILISKKIKNYKYWILSGIILISLLLYILLK
jgi:hypothetical protein